MGIKKTGNKAEDTNIQVTPFQIKDCALIVKISDLLPVINLRELRERISAAPADALYFHFCESVLRPSFDDPEFHNDFAIWARRSLHDHILAERLENIDPYSFPTMNELRKELLELIEDRLSESNQHTWVSEDSAFYFHQATTVVFDTSQTIDAPEDIGKAVALMTTSSLYYHFWEARRRTPGGLDDFSVWLGNWNDRGQLLINAFEQIDFFFMSLRELQARLCHVIRDILNNGVTK